MPTPALRFSKNNASPCPSQRQRQRTALSLSPFTPLSSPLGNTPSLAASPTIITPPPKATTVPRAPPPLPPRHGRRPDPVGATTPALISVPSTTAPAVSTPVAPPASVLLSKKKMTEFISFTGRGDGTDKLSAANFVKRMNHQFRVDQVMDINKKLVEIADHFDDASPADVWLAALVSDPKKPKAATDWDAWCDAFRTQFKGAPSHGRARQRKYHRRGDKDIYVLSDFVHRLRKAVAMATAGANDTGLWSFYTALPPVLQEAIGGFIPGSWDDAVKLLEKVPQTKIDAVTSGHRELQGKIDALQRRFEQAMRVAPRTASSPVVPAHSVPIAPPAHPNTGLPAPRAPPTNAQKDELHTMVHKCIRHTNPDTLGGRAQHARDIVSWDQKFGRLRKDERQLEKTGYPLTPGVPPPCSGECWRCGVGTTPPHPKTTAGCGRAPLPTIETAFRALAGTWLGRVDFGPVARVLHVEAVEVKPWFDGTIHPMEQGAAEEAGFGEGLQQ
ncbi:hypothetical protein DFH07DRAFT_963434 [Mycena maculata]|uniref:Gag protein n=1 Tax=Mycena maculata TaxID=230809 RepID=A0AAD7IKI2_9AGAR|nr:hypothetical protein DFH07DRAFT_963434 [Mycena maculata]